MTGITPNPNLKTFAQVYGAQPAFNNPAAAPILTANPVVAAPAVTMAPNALAQSTPVMNLNNNNLEKTPKADTITIAGQKIRKKTLAFAGLTAAAFVLAGAIQAVCTARAGKTPVVPPEVKAMSDITDDLSKKAGELVEGVQKKISDVTTMFKNGGKEEENGITVRIMSVLGDENHKTMQEINKDGDVIRTSDFVDGILESIEEATEGGKNNRIWVFKGLGFEYADEITEDGKTITRLLQHFTSGDAPGHIPGHTYFCERFANKTSDIQRSVVMSKDGGTSSVRAEEFIRNIADGFETVKRMNRATVPNGNLVLGGYEEYTKAATDVDYAKVKDLYYDAANNVWQKTSLDS